MSIVVAPLLLVFVLLIAAASKWRATDALQSAIDELRLPQFLHAPTHWLPASEVALALGLLLIPWWPASLMVAIAVAVLMLTYTVIVARGLTFSPRPSCGCFGRIGSPITVDTLVRNIVLTVLAGLTIAFAATRRTVVTTLLHLSAAGWGWLLAVVATGAVVRWVVREGNEPAAPYVPPTPSPVRAALDEADFEEYERTDIPPLMFMSEGRPVTLTGLVQQRAALLVWVTCSCGRSQKAMDKVLEWSESMPLISVRLVSTMPEEFTQGVFRHYEQWLFDVEGQAMRALGMTKDPAALLVGADGQLAGGPVEGIDDVIAFGEEIQAQLNGAHDFIERVHGDLHDQS